MVALKVAPCDNRQALSHMRHAKVPTLHSKVLTPYAKVLTAHVKVLTPYAMVQRPEHIRVCRAAKRVTPMRADIAQQIVNLVLVQHQIHNIPTNSEVSDLGVSPQACGGAHTALLLQSLWLPLSPHEH